MLGVVEPDAHDGLRLERGKQLGHLLRLRADGKVAEDAGRLRQNRGERRLKQTRKAVSTSMSRKKRTWSANKATSVGRPWSSVAVGVPVNTAPVSSWKRQRTEAAMVRRAGAAGEEWRGRSRDDPAKR